MKLGNILQTVEAAKRAAQRSIRGQQPASASDKTRPMSSSYSPSPPPHLSPATPMSPSTPNSPTSPGVSPRARWASDGATEEAAMAAVQQATGDQQQPGAQTDDPMIVRLLTARELAVLMVSLEPGGKCRAMVEYSNRSIFDTLRVLIKGLKGPRKPCAMSPRQDPRVSVTVVQLLDGFRTLLGSPRRDPRTRSSILRAMRYLVRDRGLVEAVVLLRIDVFIVRSLERESQDTPMVYERLEALKLIAKLVQMDSTRAPVSLMMSLVAVCGHKDEADQSQFRRLCLETLREMAVGHTALVARCNGFRPLVDAVMDATMQDLAEPIMLTLLYLSNDSSARVYLRPFLDLQVLLSPFTNLDVAEAPDRASMLEASRRALTIMLRSWTGIILLASDERKGLAAVLHLLSDHSLEETIRAAVFEVLEDVLKPLVTSSLRQPTRTPTEYGSSTADLGGPGSPDAWGEDFPHGKGAKEVGAGASEVHNLLDSYLAFLLAVLIKCGLLECLTAFAISESDDMSRRATALVTDISRIIPKLLPQAQCVALMSMASTVTMCDSQGGCGRTSASRALALRASDLIMRLGEPGDPTEETEPRPGGEQVHSDAAAAETTVQFAMGVLREVGRICHPLEAEGYFHTENARDYLFNDLKPYLDSITDKAVLENKIIKTRVMTGKDPLRWDWEMILSTAEDTLVSPARLSDVVKTKVTFLRRLCDCFKLVASERGFFPDLPWEPSQLKYVLVACNIFNSLIMHTEGLIFLMTEPRARTMHELSAQIQQTVNDPTGTAAAAGFDLRSCSRTLSREYFTLVGLMSSSENGLDLLKSTGILHHFYYLANRPELDYLSRLVLINLDYTSSSLYSRELLQMWMTSGSLNLRLFAINVLKTLLYSKVPEFDAWGIEILVTQLHFDDQEVVRAAIRVLEEAAHDPVYLRAIIYKRPELLHRAEARNLLLFFLSTEAGIEYVDQIGWLATMKEAWGCGPEWDDTLSPLGGSVAGGGGAGGGLGLTVGVGTTAGPAEKAKRGWELCRYVHNVESRLMRSLHCISNKGSISVTAAEAAGPVEQTPQHGGAARQQPLQTPIVVKCGDLPGLNVPIRDVRGLLALPWNIQVQVYQESPQGLDVAGTDLCLDTSVDATAFRPVQRYAEDSDDVYGNYYITVKGVLLDQAGKPLPYSLGADQSLRACLRIGNCFLDRQGTIAPDKRFHREARAAAPPELHPARNSASIGDLNAVLGAFVDEFDLNETFSSPASPAPPPDVWEDTQQMDWSVCRSRERQGAEQAAVGAEQTSGSGAASGLGSKLLRESKRAAQAGKTPYTVVVPDEPAKWTFLRPLTCSSSSSTSASASSTAGGMIPGGASGNRKGSSSSASTSSKSFAGGGGGVAGGGGGSVKDMVHLAYVEFVVVFEYQNRFVSPLPIHAYGELVKTEKGCAYLRDSGLMDGLLSRCRWHGPWDNRRSIQKRAMLWALGHMCSTEKGVQMVLRASPDLIQWLVLLAETHENLSMRGTCFCVLDLVAKSDQGRLELKRVGWEVGGGTVRGVECCMPITVPSDVGRMLRMPDDGFRGSQVAMMKLDGVSGRYLPSLPSMLLAGGESRAIVVSVTPGGRGVVMERDKGSSKPPPPMEEEVYELIVKLSNYVVRKDAQAQLARLRRKSRYRHKFASLRFFLRVHELMEQYCFKLPVRRFITELFSEVDLSPVSWADLNRRRSNIGAADDGAGDGDDDDIDDDDEPIPLP